METRVVTTRQADAIDQAVEVLQAGGLVAFPTDTLYGLAAMAFDPNGIERLYLAKGRDESKAIPVLIGSIEQLSQVATGLTPPAQSLAGRYWPGPLTLVIPRSPALPENISHAATIGVRMPNHPFVLALLRRTGPLAVTSANLSGGQNSSSAQDVMDQLGGRIELILDGGTTPGAVPSTVVDCTGMDTRILRQGVITAEQVQQAIGPG